jgi:hypothetical protein
MFAATLGVVKKEMRATSGALMNAFTIGLGGGSGPVIVGVLSDHFKTHMADGDALRWATISLSVAGFLASLCYYRSGLTIRQEFEG